MRILSEWGEIRGGRLGEETERGVALASGVSVICIFYDAASCQNTRSHAAVPLAQSLWLCISFSFLLLWLLVRIHVVINSRAQDRFGWSTWFYII